MTVDTTVTNGRIIGPSGVRDGSLTIHDGTVQEAVELEDVWRSVNASGFLVWPGLIQFGSTDPGSSLEQARNGITTIIVPGAGLDASSASLDFVSLHDIGEHNSHSANGVFTVTSDSDLSDLATIRISTAIRMPASVLKASAWSGSENVIAIVESMDDWRISREFGSSTTEIPLSALRSDEDLWDLIADPEINVHVTNHGAPDSPILPFLFHEGHVKRNIQLPRLASVTSAIPASVYGFAPAKGWIETGSDGDLAVFDPESEDPYRRYEWPGRIILSLQRGNILFHTGQLHALPGAGIDLYTR